MHKGKSYKREWYKNGQALKVTNFACIQNDLPKHSYHSLSLLAFPLKSKTSKKVMILCI